MTRQDLRLALRVHVRRPWLTAAVVATLALGIGANTAIFNIVNGVLLRPLAYPDSDRLVRIYQTFDALKSSPNPRLQAIWNRIPVSYLNVVDWRRESRQVTIGLYQAYTTTLTGAGEPEQLEGSRVDIELFRVLGVDPAQGRGFDAGDVESKANVVILSHGLWQQAFGGDPNVFERTIELDGQSFDVIGIMPAGFRIAGRAGDQLWAPIHWSDDDLTIRDNQLYSALGRLHPDASAETAREDMDRGAANLAEAYPDTNGGTGIRMVPLIDTLVDESRPLLYLLMAAVAVVLVVACVNVAHLLLAQATSRRGELAIRLALGAGRGHLVRQLLAESVPLALTGGAAGLGLAVVVQDALLTWIPADLPRTESIGLDLRVLAFTFGTSLAAALICGLLPAWLSSGRSLLTDVKNGGAPAGDARRGHALLAHGGFVIAEIALALMLATGAGLLTNSFLRLSAVEPGFTTAGRLVQEIRLPASRYQEEHRRAEFASRLLAALRRLPEVEHAALTTKPPLAGPAFVWGFEIPGLDAGGEKDWTQGRSASMKFVTPEYFRTLGIPLALGRTFTDSDRPESGRVVVVNQTLAAQHWPQADAVGQTVVMGSDKQSYTVVGVVGDVKHDGLEAASGALMYQPWSQGPSSSLSAVLAVDGDPTGLAPAVRKAIRDIDPGLPLPQALTLEDLASQSLHVSRSRTVLVTLLAGLGVLLALIGVYAVTSFTVQRRVREIGVRMALGAGAAAVHALVLRRVLALSAVGVALGAAGTFFGSKLLQGLLFGVEPTDPATFAVAAILIVTVCLLAGYLPARRAARVDPVSALRAE